MGSVAPLQADASLVNPEAEAPEAPEAPGGAARYALRRGEAEGYVSQLVQIGDKEREHNFLKLDF